MPRYSWKGKTAQGREIKGELRAGSLDEAVTTLQNRGIIVGDVKEKGARRFSLKDISIGGRISLKDIAVFCRQFATMITAGVPVVQCLEILADQTSKDKFKKLLRGIRMDVETGKTLADALAKNRKVFGDMIINMTEVGETGGILGITYQSMAEYLEKMMALKRKVRSAMAYPIVVLIVSIVVTMALLIFLIPTFTSMYIEAGVELPTPTRIVVALSNILRSNLLYIIVGFFAFIFLFRWAIRTKKGKVIVDHITLRLPIFGPLIRKSAISRFARTLGMLVKSGVPILQGLEITARASGNKVLENAIMKSRTSIGAGKTIAAPLKESGVFPPLVVHLVAIGEQTGKLREMLDKLATFYEEEVDAAVSGLASILEPLMLVAVGAFIGGILMAMYLPIFSMAATIR